MLFDMEVLCTVILLIECILGIVFSIYFWLGPKFTVTDPSCPQDVKNVKTNKLITKIVPTVMTVLSIVVLILL